MKRFRISPGAERPAPPPRMSRQVRTPLLIAAGLIGVPLAIAALWPDDEEKSAAAGSPATVDANTAYPMNHFLPGAGYYHAPFHAWFPLPFNSYDASRGWFRGGQWRAAAQESDAERQETARMSGFAGRGGGAPGARVMTSRPAPDAVQRANAGAAATHPSQPARVQRNGFGSSSRPGIS